MLEMHKSCVEDGTYNSNRCDNNPYSIPLAPLYIAAITGSRILEDDLNQRGWFGGGIEALGVFVV